MRPFILHYAENCEILDSEPLNLDYSEELNLNVVAGTNEPAINLALSNLNTFTKAGEEPTDYTNNLKVPILDGGTFTRTQESTDNNGGISIAQLVSGETHTYDNKEGTDFNNQISRIAKRMSLESLTEARESTDVK